MAGALHACGIPWPGALIGPHPVHNPTGHWEDRKLHDLDRQWHRMSEDDPDLRPETDLAPAFEMREGPTVTPRAAAHTLYRNRLHELATEGGPVWGTKSTFAYVNWPEVKDLYPRDRRILVVHRDPEAVVASRMKHGDLDSLAALRLHQALLARLFLASLDWETREYILHVRYEALLQDTERTLSDLLEFALEGVPWPTVNPNAGVDFVDPTLNHHKQEVRSDT